MTSPNIFLLLTGDFRSRKLFRVEKEKALVLEHAVLVSKVIIKNHRPNLHSITLPGQQSKKPTC